MKILVYDAAEDSLVGKSWALGAKLLGPLFFDAVIAATSWKEAMDKLAWAYIHNGEEPLDEVQLWSHGFFGKPLIAGQSIPLTDERVFKVTKRWWFRCCYTMGGEAGLKLAKTFTSKGIEVAGHNVVIGLWGLHPGLYAARPNEEPWWSAELPKNHHKPGPFSPRTISALKMNLPEWAFQKKKLKQ